MPVNLSTTTSIIDYLSSKNQDSSFAARKKLYNEMGLNTRLGDYVGSADQNTNFLNSLRSSSATGSSSVPKFNAFTPMPSWDPNATYDAQGNIVKPKAAPSWNPDATYDAQGNMVSPTSKPIATAPKTAAPTPQPVAPAPAPAMSAVKEAQTGATTATDALSALGIDVSKLTKGMTQEELTAAVENDPAWKIYMETVQNKGLGQQATAEAKKAELESKAAATKTEMEQKLAERGLAFSGIRTQAVQDLAASLATSKLGVDRQLALDLLDSDTAQRSKFLDIAADVLKGAEDNKKSAIDQLNKAGLVYIDGALLPSLEYRKMLQEKSEFRDVSGVGLVKITGNDYEVVVPEKAKPDELTYKQKVDAEMKLANDFEKYAKTSRDASRSISIIDTGYKEAVKAGLDENSLNAPSQAVLVTFQKMLDPTSVVRESEYARSGSGQSLANRIQGTVEKLKFGGAGVTQKELAQFYKVSKELLKGYQAEQLNFAKRTQKQADSYGLDIENILTPDVIGLLGGSSSSGKPSIDSFSGDGTSRPPLSSFEQ